MFVVGFGKKKIAEKRGNNNQTRRRSFQFFFCRIPLPEHIHFSTPGPSLENIYKYICCSFCSCVYCFPKAKPHIPIYIVIGDNFLRKTTSNFLDYWMIKGDSWNTYNGR